MKKLSIIIPHYREGEYVVGKLLISIDFQSYINFNDIEVVIVNDGEGIILSDEFLNSFHNFKPTYIKLDNNVGPGMTRQAGIDNSTGEWITFIDSDDRLFSCCSLYTYIRSIEEYPKASAIFHRCAVEVPGEILGSAPIPLLRGSQEAGTLHAGLFKRATLVEGNIQFIPELTSFEEDIYFINTALTYAYYTSGEVVVIDSPPESATYLYAVNSESLTRRDSVLFMVDVIKSRCVRCKAFLSYLESHGFSGLHNGNDVESAIYEIWITYVSRSEWLKLHSFAELDNIKDYVFETCIEIVQKYGFSVDKGLEVYQKNQSIVTVNTGTEMYEYHISKDGYMEFITALTDKNSTPPLKMNKLLSIIIPHFREDERTVRKLLSSIDLQTYINFDDIEVIIVNDGGGLILPDELLNSFDNFKPIYIVLDENVGPGMARQAGIDACTGEYITFIDADDRLSSCRSLYLYMCGIANYPDVPLIIYNYAKEKRFKSVKDAVLPIVDGSNGEHSCILFAKLYKKSFLVEGDIRFTPELKTFEEDLYFTNMLFAYLDHTKSEYCAASDVPYLYGDNPDSLTRKDAAFFILGMLTSKCISSKLYLQYLAKHGIQELFEAGAVERITYMLWIDYKACSSWLEQNRPEELDEIKAAIFRTCVDIVREHGFNMDKTSGILEDIPVVVLGRISDGTMLRHEVNKEEYIGYFSAVIEAAKQN